MSRLATPHIRHQEHIPEHRSSAAQQNIGSLERWMSLGIGSYLVWKGLKAKSLGGLLLASAGGGLLYRGWSGHCYCYQLLGRDTAHHPAATAIPAQQGSKVQQTIIVKRPHEELFQFWRNFANLPSVMDHLVEVTVLDSQRSHWVAKGPAGAQVDWVAEIINERPGEMIAWRSTSGSQIETAGSVHFRPLGPDTTELDVSMKYNPPAGKVGDAVARLLGSGLKQQLEDDLQNFKRFME